MPWHCGDVIVQDPFADPLNVAAMTVISGMGGNPAPAQYNTVHAKQEESTEFMIYSPFSWCVSATFGNNRISEDYFFRLLVE